MFLGFVTPILLGMLFLAYNGELTNTLSFTIFSISRGSGYLAETPFDTDGFSFNGLIKIFYEDKYFYLLRGVVRTWVTLQESGIKNV